LGKNSNAVLHAGDVYTNWTIVTRATNASNHCARFVCKCNHCGHTKLHLAFQLRDVVKYERELHCPNCARIERAGKHKSNPKTIVKVGDKSFNWELILTDEFRLSGKGYVKYYWCKCKCGNFGFVNKQRFTQRLAVQCDICNQEAARLRRLNTEKDIDGE
jgi:hypothetical protein